MTIRTGPCDAWTSAAEVEAGPWSVPAGITPQQVEQAVWAASDVCFQLGGQRWPGTGCNRTLRPTDCSCLASIPLPQDGGTIRRVAVHGGRTACRGGNLLDVGVYPVTSIHSVKIDGTAQALGDFRVHDDRYVAYTDGTSWPCLSVYDQSKGTPKVEVVVQFGAAPPDLGKLAATALARELILSFADDDNCRLDRRVRTVTREGVTMDFALPGLVENLQSGATGIPEVDLFVVAHNPHRLRRASRFVNL